MPKITKTLNQPSSARFLSGISTDVRRADSSSGAKELGRSLEKVGADMQRKAQHTKNVNYVSSASIKSTEALTKAEEELRPILQDSPEKYSDALMDKMGKAHSKIIESAPSQEAKNQLAQQFGARIANTRLNSLKKQQFAIAGKEFTIAKENVGTLERRVFENPSEFADSLEQLNQVVEASKTYLAPDMVRKFGTTARKGIADKYVKGLMASDLPKAKSVMSSDALDGIFSVDEKNKYTNAIEAEEIRVKQEELIVDNIQREGVVLDRELGIFKGDVKQIDLDEDLEKERYGKKEYLYLSKILRAENDRKLSQSVSVADIETRLTEGKPIDATSKEGKKGLEDYYETIVKPTLTPETGSETILAFVNKFSYMPKEVKNEVLTGLHNGNNRAVAESAKLLDGLVKSRPQLSRQFNNSRDIARAMNITSSISAGMRLEDAIKGADNMLVEKNTAEYKAREQDFRDNSREFDQGEFTELLVNDPDEVPLGMVTDQQKLYREFAVNHRMSDADAWEAANTITKSRWGISTATGEPEYMKDSPELYYNKEGMNPSWIQTQLKSEMNTILPGVEDYSLSVDPNTEFTGAPEYFVNYLSPKGFPHIVRDDKGDILTWKPDIETSKDAKEQFSKQTEEGTQKLKEKRLEQKGLEEGLPTGPGGI